MSRRETYESRTQTLIMPVLEQNGFELIDVEYVKEAGNWFLRAYIDKEGGITINDCELVSRYLSDRLDEEDFIDESYTLEVSSPGLDRPLKKDKDLERHLGDEVDVRLYRPLSNHKEGIGKEVTGTLRAWDRKTITIEVSGMGDIQIEREKVALVRLALDF